MSKMMHLQFTARSKLKKKACHECEAQFAVIWDKGDTVTQDPHPDYCPKCGTELHHGSWLSAVVGQTSDSSQFTVSKWMARGT